MINHAQSVGKFSLPRGNASVLTIGTGPDLPAGVGNATARPIELQEGGHVP